MTQPSDLSGIIPAIATALTEDERVHEEGMRRLVRRAVDARCGGVFALGTMGEGPYLRDEEKLRAVRIVADEVAGRVPVLASCAEASTTRCIELARAVAAEGVDVIVALLPINLPPTPAEMATHFRAIADAVDRPIVIYNVPVLTGANVPVDLITELADDDRFIGTKDSSGDFGQVLDLITEFRGSDRFAVFQGDELRAGASLLMGADGCVLGTPGNLVPRVCVALYEAATRQNIEEVFRLQALVKQAWEISFHEGSSFIGSAKAALEMLGVCGPHCCRPFAMPDEAVKRRIAKQVEALREHM